MALILEHVSLKRASPGASLCRHLLLRALVSSRRGPVFAGRMLSIRVGGGIGEITGRCETRSSRVPARASLCSTHHRRVLEYGCRGLPRAKRVQPGWRVDHRHFFNVVSKCCCQVYFINLRHFFVETLEHGDGACSQGRNAFRRGDGPTTGTFSAA